MDWVQLSQGCRYKETVYYLPFSSQGFLVFSWSTSGGWKAELTLESPIDLEPGTHALGIQRFNRGASAQYAPMQLKILVEIRMLGILFQKQTKQINLFLF